MDFHGIWCSSVTFQFHASGFLKALLWVVTTSTLLLALFPRGLSTEPFATLAFGWNGGLPPRKIVSLTPRRVTNRYQPARRTGLGLRWQEQTGLGREVPSEVSQWW